MLLAIDLRGLVCRAYFADQRQPEGALERAAHMIDGIAREVGADVRLLAFEQGETFRHKMLPAYKSTRKPKPSGLIAAIDAIGPWAANLHLPVLAEPGFEADDVLATIAAVAVADKEPCVIVSDDKDLGQCLTAGVRQWRPGKPDHLADEFTFYREWGVPPGRLPDYIGLAGDASDGIPGVPGIGDGKARRLLALHGSIEGVLEVADQGDRDAERVATYSDQALLCCDVATLRSELPLKVRLAEALR